MTNTSGPGATIELAVGPIDYVDTGGDGPCLLLLNGVLMNNTAWTEVIEELSRTRPAVRCIAPTLPLGGHHMPAPPDADLSVDSLVHAIAELLERLDLHDVTVVINDWGGPQLLVEHGLTERVGRLVLVACSAFDNFPPGRPGRQLSRLAGIPGGFDLLGLLLRTSFARRRVAAEMVKHPVPEEVLESWFRGFSRDRRVREDLRRYGRSDFTGMAREWSAGLAGFHQPALVVWATEDTMMPREHGPRLVELLPDAELVEIDDSYTVIPLDQPRLLAQALSDFVHR